MFWKKPSHRGTKGPSIGTMRKGECTLLFLFLFFITSVNKTISKEGKVKGVVLGTD